MKSSTVQGILLFPTAPRKKWPLHFSSSYNPSLGSRRSFAQTSEALLGSFSLPKLFVRSPPAFVFRCNARYRSLPNCVELRLPPPPRVFELPGEQVAQSPHALLRNHQTKSRRKDGRERGPLRWAQKGGFLLARHMNEFAHVMSHNIDSTGPIGFYT